MGKSHSGDDTLQILKSTTRLPQLFPDQNEKESKLPDQLRLTIVGSGMSFNIACKDNIILGRRSSSSKNVTVDLSPFSHTEHGISRQHCALSIIYGVLMVQDLDSTNGTWLNQKALQPYQRYEISSGDMLILGRLTMQVEFVYNQSPALA